MRSWTTAVTMAALVGLLGILAGCSGVPTSSRPQPIRTVGGSSPISNAQIGPTPGDEPREIVLGFLKAGLNADARHSGARQFLTADAGSHWKDGTVTVVSDYQVALAETHADTSTVTVTAVHVGDITSDGVYSPEKKGLGASEMAPRTYQLKRVDGQWRIFDLPSGVMIRKADLQQYFTARPLYFFDSTETRLVPDLRYTALSDQELATWMLGEVLGGPRSQLGQAVQNEIPDQVDARSASITLTDPIRVEIPTISQLNPATLRRLAIQLAYTFGPLRFSARLTLTDSGKPVAIPDAGQVFSTVDFPGYSPDQAEPGAQSYYLRNGGVVSSLNQRPLAGQIGNGAYGLTSLAVSRTDAGGLLIAGINNENSLLIGTPTGLVRVAMPPRTLSRPEWQPNTNDVWVAVGEALYWVDLADRNHTPHQVTVPASLGVGLPKGQITAVKFSRDGVQLAVVVEASDHSTRAVFFGAVARSGRSVAIEEFEPITPTALAVSDLAWQDSTTLLMIAGSPGQEPGIWRAQSDGSNLDTQLATGLPRGLVSVAAMAGQSPVVATTSPGTGPDNSAVWVQAGSSWTSIAGSGATTTGYSPAYSP
jgi:lipoprotein LpqB-like beta-propeller protein